MVSAAAGQQAGYAELRERTVRYVVNQVHYLQTTHARFLFKRSIFSGVTAD